MSLFADDHVAPPAERPRRRITVGGVSLVVAFALLIVLALAPSPYVIQQPGPVFDTLGSVPTGEDGEDGEDVPMIEVAGTETFETEGSLDMLTVSVVGTPEQRPTWFEVATSWFDRSKAVLPIEAVYPPGVTSEQRDEENATLMTDSQQTAVAAALRALDYDVEEEVVVGDIPEGAPAEGRLEIGDVILRANGEAVDTVTTLRRIIADNGPSKPVSFDILRDGADETVDVTPAEQTLDDGSSSVAVGVVASSSYEFPFDVSIQLENVGGPSAGMMFALGIIDKVTEGPLTDGRSIAGTGTIDDDGNVGPIGGIRQKLYGADNAGAEIFLAPAANCDEVVGHVPGDLEVFAVATLDESLDVLAAIGGDGNVEALPTCEDVLAG
ncbi:PDZ domain-containing protein [Labedella phragmitis]|uniref:endopeptidase La n=1 Tax=Labedella phragmitis TaxID=2498849 RepID=A0A3S5CDV2_9MICO|nr:PDZ domain-containing protein [Labedella phragmitis]RWZ49699.1 PDZ domain-containing protein [Labedella phragmitis]